MICLLEKIRFDLYASVMGITGLGLTWHFGAHCFELPAIAGDIGIVVGFILYISLNLLNIVRLILQPKSLFAEWQNIEQFNFFPAFTISGSLLAMGILPHSSLLAAAIWWPTVMIQILLIVIAFRRWLTEKLQLQQISPTWLIPMVGNASPCFAGVPLGYGTFSYVLLMFAVGCWLLFMPLLLGRLILNKPDATPHITPSIAILVSAPAVISVGLYHYPETASTLMPLFAYSALFFAIIIFSLLPYFQLRTFLRAWWAFTFPATALSSSLLRVYHLHPNTYHFYQAWLGLGLASGIVLLVGFYAGKDLLTTLLRFHGVLKFQKE